MKSFGCGQRVTVVPRRRSRLFPTNCSSVLCCSSSEVGSPMSDRRWRDLGRYCNRVAPVRMNRRLGLSQSNLCVIKPATTRRQTMLHGHNKYSTHIVESMCTWVALDVSGRGTSPARPALCWESLMRDDAGARLNGDLGDRASARGLISFNQDNEALLGSDQVGWFRPPERPRLT